MRDKPLDETERAKLRLMRAARTKVEYSHGIGGLPRKGRGQRQAKITLAPVPWKADKRDE